MTENRITELWNKAVADVGDCTYPQIITRFSEFVVLDEREACAKVCESEAQWWRDSDAEGSESLAYEDKALESAARAIRMRSNVELTGAARPYCAASVLTAGLAGNVPTKKG